MANLLAPLGARALFSLWLNFDDRVAGSSTAGYLGFHTSELLGIGDRHERGGGIACLLHLLKVHLYQQVSGAHPLSLCDGHCEALTGHFYRVDADVDENFDAVIGFDTKGMSRFSHSNNLT